MYSIFTPFLHRSNTDSATARLQGEETELTDTTTGCNSISQSPGESATESGSAVETHSGVKNDDAEPLAAPELIVVVQFDDTYLRSLPGIMRFLQVVGNFVFLLKS